MICRNCKNLARQGSFYCSPRCSRNWLKKQYRKRHREAVNKYNRFWRKGLRQRQRSTLFQHEICYFCGRIDHLIWHHLEYLPENVIRLCDMCHKKLHLILKYKNGKSDKVEVTPQEPVV